MCIADNMFYLQKTVHEKHYEPSTCVFSSLNSLNDVIKYLFFPVSITTRRN